MSGLLLWAAFWLWGVRWSRVWAVLSAGGWAVLALVIVVTALVWSQPRHCGPSAVGMQ